MGRHPQNTRHTGEGRYLLPRRDKKTTPALRATPPPEGNLVRAPDINDVRKIKSISSVSPADCVLAASCASLGLVSPHLRCHSEACPGPAKSQDFVGGAPRIQVNRLARMRTTCVAGAWQSIMNFFDLQYVPKHAIIYTESAGCGFGTSKIP